MDDKVYLKEARTSFFPMAESAPELFPEPPPFYSRLRFRNLLRFLGPGAVIASVTIGSGELVWASRSGAIFGYAMLWCFVYAGVFKAVQVYAANRHITLTGEHPIISWRSLPGPPLWLPILIVLPVVLGVPIIFSVLPELLATFIHQLTGLPLEGNPVGIWHYEEVWMNIWATLTIMVCLILVLGSSFRWVERISTIILGIMVLCMIAAVFVVGIDLIEALKGMFVIQVKDYEPWITENPALESVYSRNPWLEVAVYLSAVGGGTEAYLGYTGTIREKRWGLAGRVTSSRDELELATNRPDQLRRARIWARAPLLDACSSFFFVILITLLFGLLGASLLHSEHQIPDGNTFLTMQEGFLTAVHPSLGILYRIGVFLAFIGTIYGVFVVLRYSISEGLIGIFTHRVPQIESKKWPRWIYTYCFLGGLVLIWVPEAVSGSVVDRITLINLFTASTGCGLWCFAMLWADKRRLPPALQMKVPLRVALFIAGTIMLGLGIQAILVYFGLSQ